MDKVIAHEAISFKAAIVPPTVQGHLGNSLLRLEVPQICSTTCGMQLQTSTATKILLRHISKCCSRNLSIRFRVLYPVRMIWVLKSSSI